MKLIASPIAVRMLAAMKLSDAVNASVSICVLAPRDTYILSLEPTEELCCRRCSTSCSRATQYRALQQFRATEDGQPVSDNQSKRSMVVFFSHIRCSSEV